MTPNYRQKWLRYRNWPRHWLRLQGSLHQPRLHARTVKYQFETSKPMPKAPTNGNKQQALITLTVPRC